MKTGIGIKVNDGMLSVYFTVQGTPDVPVSEIPLSLSPFPPTRIPEGMKPVEVILGGGPGTAENKYACLGGKYAMLDPKIEGYCLVKQ